MKIFHVSRVRLSGTVFGAVCGFYRPLVVLQFLASCCELNITEDSIIQIARFFDADSVDLYDTLDFFAHILTCFRYWFWSIKITIFASAKHSAGLESRSAGRSRARSAERGPEWRHSGPAECLAKAKKRYFWKSDIFEFATKGEDTQHSSPRYLLIQIHATQLKITSLYLW